MINLKSERYLAKVCVNQNEFVKVPKWAEAHNNRVKVRITGLHPKDKNILSDDDLPWAIVSMPPTSGNFSGQSCGLWGGEWVIVQFLDDTNQIPVIVGVLSKNVTEYLDQDSGDGFKQENRFNSGLTASPTQITGGNKPTEPAQPSKEELNAAKSDQGQPVGFSESEEGVTQPTQEEENFFEGTAEPLDPSQDAFGNTIEQTDAEAAAQRERIRQNQTVERAIGKMNTGDIAVQPGGVPVNRTPTPDELQQFESNGYRFVPGSGGGGTIVKNSGQNYG